MAGNTRFQSIVRWSVEQIIPWGCRWFVGQLSRVALGARSAPSRPVPDESVAYASVGYAPSDLPLVSRGFRMAGWPALPMADLHYGGGGYSRFGDRLIGGQGSGGGNERRKLGWRLRGGSGTGMMFGGYRALDTGRVRLAPFAGIGGYGEGLRVAPPGRGARRRPAGPGVAFGSGGLALRAGWTLELRIPLAALDLLAGVQVGVTVLPAQSGLRGQSRWVSFLPAPRRVRPFINLIVGGGIPRGGD